MTLELLRAHLYFSNHLGSASVITDINGNIENQTDYYPYGGICYTSGSDPNRYKFTGKERDAESGNDYFGARYYASTMGRFFTPDWAAKPATVPYAKFGDPQSLNLYGYVENAPINRIDADGHVTSGDFRCPDQRHCVDQSPSGMSSVGQAAVTLSDVPTPSSLGFSTDGMGEWPDWNPHGLPPCLCGEGDSVADTLGKSARRGHSWYNFVYKWGSWGIEADELADELNADKTIRDIAGKVYMNPNQPEWLEIYRLADQNTYLDLARQGAKALDIVPTPTGGAGETVFDLNGKVRDQNNEQIYQLTEQMALRQ